MEVCVYVCVLCVGDERNRYVIIRLSHMGYKGRYDILRKSHTELLRKTFSSERYDFSLKCHTVGCWQTYKPRYDFFKKSHAE